MNIEALSFDQLRVILCVVEQGSFSAAARRVRRTQSAVSHAIAQAEAQLGVRLFDRDGHRPTLTAAGRALVSDIRDIVGRVDDLRARAHAISAGMEPEITLAIDALCSPDALARLLATFQARFPSVSVRLHVDTLGMVVERVLAQPNALGVIATMVDLPGGLSRYAMPAIRMHTVAAPSHPLVCASGADMLESVRQSVQIVLSDRSARTAGRDYAVFSPRTWRVDDLLLKHRLIRAGIGWGALPDWLTDADRASGRLVTLRCPSFADPDDMPTQAFHKCGHVPGPAMRWLIERLCATGLNAPEPPIARGWDAFDQATVGGDTDTPDGTEVASVVASPASIEATAAEPVPTS